MATKKFAVPNWAQALIAKAAGLDPKQVAVRHEDDAHIAFVQYLPRQDVVITKATGAVSVTQEKFAKRRCVGMEGRT